MIEGLSHMTFIASDFDLYARRITVLGLEMRPPRSREGEGRSIYFYDDDNHMFELHTGTPAERLARYANVKEAAQ